MSPIEIRLILSLLTPSAVVGRSKIRLGDEGDGGYVVLDHLAPAGICLSLGVGDNVSFDLALAERGYDVLQYDHTITGPPISHERFRFHRIGISDRLPSREGFQSVTEVLETHNLRRREDLILKMDIEGSEWGAIPLMTPEDLAHFNQICIEFHNLGQLTRPIFAEMAAAVFRHLRQTHIAIHVHGNNYRPMHNVLGIPVPDVLEITLVRRRSYEFLPSTEIFPTVIDYPNKPEIPDLFLGNFRFL
ncbi:hypothetical protein [Acidiphilium sp. 20-67-58]|uniref:hypothetical protein n=1 Tax=Acidiphilium sp. 20-67-58 TaxID=1970291 RepID=UPI0025C049BD|nr:hypothetical protein [Acidiphilium sp. 20-67-58]